MADREFELRLGDDAHHLILRDHQRGEAGQGQVELTVDGRTLRCTYQRFGDQGLLLSGAFGRRLIHLAAERGGGLHLACAGASAFVQPQGRKRSGGGPGSRSPEVTPPMPAVVTQILVGPGEAVARGQGLVVVSAMKMETTLQAPWDGTVAELRVAVGDKVGPGDVLVTVTPATSEETADD